jgi:hypothetical protein
MASHRVAAQRVSRKDYQNYIDWADAPRAMGAHQARIRCDRPQIAMFTGHSVRDFEAILDAHYLSRDVHLAEIAMMKLETSTKL